MQRTTSELQTSAPPQKPLSLQTETSATAEAAQKSALKLLEIVELLPEDATLTLRNRTWRDYENLTERVGEAGGLRISFCEGELKIMTISSEHENYERLLQAMVSMLSARLRIKTYSFGSATMKKSRDEKGSEPDCCFYIQSADKLGKRIRIDFDSDPPPDVVVEIDIHHESLSKLPIYAAFGVPEVWRYDGRKLFIYKLQNNEYVEIEKKRIAANADFNSLNRISRAQPRRRSIRRARRV